MYPVARKKGVMRCAHTCGSMFRCVCCCCIHAISAGQVQTLGLSVSSNIFILGYPAPIESSGREILPEWISRYSTTPKSMLHSLLNLSNGVAFGIRCFDQQHLVWSLAPLIWHPYYRAFRFPRLSFITSCSVLGKVCLSLGLISSEPLVLISLTFFPRSATLSKRLSGEML